MSKLPKTMQEKYSKLKFQNLGDHQKYISRITKTLYYGKFPKPEELSLPVTELAAELFSEAQRGRSLDRLHYDDASNISRNACVSPCSLVLAILYLERLKKVNPEYLEKTAPSDLFLVSLMVSCKFLYDDGELDEVFIDEWALSGGTSVKRLVQLEKDFLKAIDWEIFVNKLTFWKKLTEIETALARKQGTARGFFTYTELQKLLSMIEMYKLVQNMFAVTVILITSYTAALLTLLGSVLIVSHIPGTCLQINNLETNSHTTTELLPHNQTQIMQNVNKTDVIKTNVLKADVVLDFVEPFCNITGDTIDKGNVQDMAWDWWTIPAMNWLSETSTIIEKWQPSNFDILHFVNVHRKTKLLDVEERVLKVTNGKDFEDSSWQRKWPIINEYLHNYIQNVKS